MAQNVTVAGASYSAVPSVDLPKTGGGTSSFYDVSGTTATASDVASGKVFYDASGVMTTGTASGGGSGGGSMSDPIRFFDYDGTVVASYTSVPSELPANPSHSGLVSQGWNHTLTQIQTQFAATGTCDIGQMYITESGDTEIDVSMPEGRLSPYLQLAPNGTVIIDWGDGSAVSTVTGTSASTRKNTQHTYESAGNYTIKIHVTSGAVTLIGTTTYTLLSMNNSTVQKNYVYANCVQAVRIGNNTYIGNYAFYYCHSLASITLPSSLAGIAINAFQHCHSLASITLPSRVMIIDNYAFSYCYSLASIAIPNTAVSIGANVFDYCYSLASITIPNAMSSIGGYAFRYCYSLATITFHSSLTRIGANAFYNCYSLAAITIPDGVTSIGGSVFYGCQSLATITLPSRVTTIGANAFYNCYSLAAVTIPSGVTSIGSSAFASCYGLGEIHFKGATPPSVSNANAWTSVPTDCKIYVPSGSLSAYTSAANYPSSSTYTYVEE